jgi:hypothetical protein
MTRERRTVVLRHAADYERQEEKLARRTKPVTIWAEGTKYQHGRVWKEWTKSVMLLLQLPMPPE